MNELLNSSKTERAVLMGLAFILLLVIIGAICQVVFHQSIWQGLLGMGGLQTVQTSAGIARNVISDGPVRQTLAQGYVAQQPPSPLPPTAPPPV